MRNYARINNQKVSVLVHKERKLFGLIPQVLVEYIKSDYDEDGASLDITMLKWIPKSKLLN